MGKLTTISISKETKDRLAKLGRKGQTYDAIITMVLDGALKEKTRFFGRRQ